MSDNATAEAPEVDAAPEAAAEETPVTPNDLAAEAKTEEPTETEESTETPEDEADADEAEDTDSKEEVDVEDAASLHRQLRKRNTENKRLRARAVEAERKLLQRDVADEVGLPSGMAARLVGGTREALVEDAKALMEQINKASYVPGGLPSDGVHYGDRLAGNPEDESDLSKIGARIYER